LAGATAFSSPRLFLCALVGACALGFWSLNVQALDPGRQLSQYLVDHYGRANGLPSDWTWVAREGPRGFLWVGTRGGLVRFDGSSFRVYNRHTHPVFRSSDVRSLAWSGDGALWIGTYGGGALRMRGSTFEVFDRDRGLAGNEVYEVHVASDGAVWFATHSGVSRLRDGELESWTTSDGLASNRIMKIAEDSDGTLWFSSLTDGVSAFDGEVFRTLTTENGLDSPKIHLLDVDKKLGVVAGTAEGSLLQISPELRGTSIARENDTIAEALLRDGDSNLWLGSYGGGLWRLTADGREEQLVLGNASEHIFDLHEDSRGNLWVATIDGLHRVSDSRFLSLGSPEGLADATFVVAEDERGNLWAGAEADGLFRIDRDGRITQPVPELSDSSVSSLLPLADGSLLVGTFGEGLYHLADGGLKHLGAEQGLSGLHIFALEHGDGEVVYVSSNRGTDRLYMQAHSAEPLEVLGDVTARHLRRGSDGSLWLSTNEGLLQYRRGEVRRWTREQGLPSNLISATHEDERGVLWILLRNGELARLEGESLFSYRDPGLSPLLTAFAIIGDGDRTLWISGPEGLVALPRDGLDALARGEDTAISTRHFTEGDGLRTAHFMGGFQPSAWMASDHRLWFPTDRGLTSFDPRDLASTAHALDTYVDEVRLDGQALPLDALVELPTRFDSLEIDYTAPQLANSQAVAFRYRIQPQGAWVDAGTRRTAYFTALPPGEVRFEVQASVGSDRLAPPGDATAGLTLTRKPGWRESSWIVLAAALALIAFLLTSQRVLALRTRRREAFLEDLVSRRTRELSEALAKVQTSSRTDSVTGLANRRHLEERLRAIWNLAKRSGRPVSAIMLDTDYFKEYNDGVGHTAGDECLKRIAGALGDDVTRDHDVVGRYGGDEFLILLYDSDASGAARVAERALERVRALKLSHPDSLASDFVTITAGYSTASATNDDPNSLIDAADRALYRAKAAGRNRVAGL